MRKDNLSLIALMISVLIFAASFFCYYKGIKSDLNTIITGQNLNIQATETKGSQTVTPIPTVTASYTPVPEQEQKVLISSTPVIDTAYFSETTPDPTGTDVSDNKKRVIIYNTHPFEKLDSGGEITEYSKTLANKLNDSGCLGIFLYNNNRLIADSYEKSRNLVKDNIKEYAGNIMLDIHTSDDIHLSDKDISIWIGKGNKNYEKNKQYADRLLNQINNVSPDVEAEVLLKEQYLWNQDLSDKAVLLILGNKNSGDESINEIINVLAAAIGNM